MKHETSLTHIGTFFSIFMHIKGAESIVLELIYRDIHPVQFWESMPHVLDGNIWVSTAKKGIVRYRLPEKALLPPHSHALTRSLYVGLYQSPWPAP